MGFSSAFRAVTRRFPQHHKPDVVISDQDRYLVVEVSVSNDHARRAEHILRREQVLHRRLLIVAASRDPVVVEVQPKIIDVDLNDRQRLVPHPTPLRPEATHPGRTGTDSPATVANSGIHRRTTSRVGLRASGHAVHLIQGVLATSLESLRGHEPEGHLRPCPPNRLFLARPALRRPVFSCPRRSGRKSGRRIAANTKRASQMRDPF